MSSFDHWVVLLWSICFALLQQEVAGYCGLPQAHGGQTIQAYLGNKSENLVLPWTVAIRSGLGEFKCLGSIIPDSEYSGKHKNASRLVLTAGTCFRHVLRKKWGSPSCYKVFAGLDRLRLSFNRSQEAEPQAIRVMPFNAVNENIWNGIALVTLKKPFIFNKEVSPVCLAGTYEVPSNRAKCYVSTYHKGRLDEEVVRMAPGSVCKFGHFPKLVRANGLCSLHDKSDTEKSLGGPLVCLIDGQAFQFGVYLSELITKRRFFSRKPALHFYGHVSSVFDRTPAALLRYIELGLLTKPSSPSSPASSPGQGCKDPLPQGPVYCGDTSTFGRTLESYVVGNDAQDMFPWNVIITSNTMGTTKCIGSLVHKGDYRQMANSSDIILTGADCFSRYGTASAEAQLRVYVGSSRFSRLRRPGTKVKISNVNLYGLRRGGNQMRGGIAIVKLERPLVRKDNVVPVCLAPKDSLPPPSASCYVTHYDKRESRIDEEIAMLTRNGRCLAAQDSSETGDRGICALEEKKKHYIQLGSPLICLVDGRAYQYGVYLNQLSLRLNDKMKQDVGFYGEISIVHEVFAGKKVSPLPSNSGHQVTLKPEKPPHVSSSSSSSTSRITSSEGSGESTPLIRLNSTFLQHRFGINRTSQGERSNTSITHLGEVIRPYQVPSKSAGPPLSASSSSSTSSSSSSSSESKSTSAGNAGESKSKSDESTVAIRLNAALIRSRLAKTLGGNYSVISNSSSGIIGEKIRPYKDSTRPTRTGRKESSSSSDSSSSSSSESKSTSAGESRSTADKPSVAIRLNAALIRSRLAKTLGGNYSVISNSSSGIIGEKIRPYKDSTRPTRTGRKESSSSSDSSSSSSSESKSTSAGESRSTADKPSVAIRLNAALIRSRLAKTLGGNYSVISNSSSGIIGEKIRPYKDSTRPTRTGRKESSSSSDSSSSSSSESKSTSAGNAGESKSKSDESTVAIRLNAALIRSRLAKTLGGNYSVISNSSSGIIGEKIRPYKDSTRPTRTGRKESSSSSDSSSSSSSESKSTSAGESRSTADKPSVAIRLNAALIRSRLAKTLGGNYSVISNSSSGIIGEKIRPYKDSTRPTRTGRKESSSSSDSSSSSSSESKSTSAGESRSTPNKPSVAIRLNAALIRSRLAKTLGGNYSVISNSSSGNIGEKIRPYKGPSRLTRTGRKESSSSSDSSSSSSSESKSTSAGNAGESKSKSDKSTVAIRLNAALIRSRLAKTFGRNNPVISNSSNGNIGERAKASIIRAN